MKQKKKWYIKRYKKKKSERMLHLATAIKSMYV